jgi:hypothetical protein
LGVALVDGNGADEDREYSKPTPEAVRKEGSFGDGFLPMSIIV